MSDTFKTKNLTMLTDFYELTMANGYFVNNLADTVACFDMFFRRVPDDGGFAISWVSIIGDYILAYTVLGFAVTFVGLTQLPDTNTPYAEGMNVLTIVLFCIIPMVAWILTLIAMKGYKLTGPRMKEIQAVNACRKDAIADGMTVERALETYKDVEDIPAEYKASLS